MQANLRTTLKKVELEYELAELDDGKGGQRKKYGRLLMLEVKNIVFKRVDMGNLGLKNQRLSQFTLLVMEDIFQQCLMPGLLNKFDS
jgi:hypothetical protein